MMKKSSSSAGFSVSRHQAFLISSEEIEPTLLNNTKHITHILHQDPGDGVYGVDVLFGVVGEVDAGHEVEIFEDRIQTLADAGVEVTQWRVGINEQDGMVSGGVGHWGVIAQL